MVTSLDRFEYFCKEIVIGGSLNSLLYAWFTGATLICADPKQPFFFEDSVGVEKNKIWRKMFFLLSMSGQAPIPASSQSIRIENNLVKVVTSHSRLVRFRYEKIKLFDPAEVGATQKGDLHMVLDWMHVNTGAKHSYDFIKTEDNFVKSICFYPISKRAGEDFKNLVSISYLSDDELREYYFSDTYAKFKVEKLMKESGIKGRKNGFKNGVPYHLNAKVTPTRRDVFCVDKYDLEYCQLTDEEILEKFSGPPKNKKIEKLLRYLA